MDLLFFSFLLISGGFDGGCGGYSLPFSGFFLRGWLLLEFCDFFMRDGTSSDVLR